jgi:hypothetical protein
MAPGALLTGASQIEWAEALLLGDGTELYVTNLTGWDEMPPVDSGNVARSARHGSWPGRAYAQERIVTVEFDLLPASYDTSALRAAVRAATTISEDATEQALVVRDDDGAALLAWGQVHRRALPMGQGYRRRVEGCAIQWTCADPRRYSLTEQTVTADAPSAGTGLVFPLTFPLDFGIAATTGTATAANAGQAPAHPLITITGPAVTPRVVNMATGAVLEFDLALVAGESLVIDTNAGTVLLGGTGNRLYALTAASVPVEAFVLAPGDNPLALRAASFPAPGAQLSVTWRSATW